MRRDSQRGAALLTVLLLTATLAVLAIAMTDLMTRAIARAGAGEARDQAFWALQGIETVAIGVLEEQGEVIDEVGAEAFFAEPVVLPFEDAIATIRFTDRSNCFNINDLVDSGEDGAVADEAAIQRFTGIIISLGGSSAAGEQMGARIADFMDADRRAGTGGAEDYDYQRRAVPYRTPGRMLASVSELRAIDGFSRNVYRSLAPYLCSLPHDGPQILNVNTLSPADAPLLASVLGDALGVDTAARLIAGRPEQGYASVEEFMSNPVLAGADLPSDATTFLGVGPNILQMEIVLEGPQGRLRQTSLLQRDGASAEVIERQIGERLP